jgi:hypothetical protein
MRADVLRAVREDSLEKLVATLPSSVAAKWAIRAPLDGLLPEQSNRFRYLPYTTHAQMRCVMQLRCGAWVGNALLHRWKLAPTARCPHCLHQSGGYDDGAHSAAGCKHPALNGPQTFRHDKAAHILYNLLLSQFVQKRRGKWHVFISAGRRFADSAEPLTPTIPAWALPGNVLTPDLVIIDGWAPGDPDPTPADFKNISFTIIDVAYGRGDTSTARITKKQRYYAQLVADLRAAGFTVHGTALGSGLFPDVRKPSTSGVAAYDHVAVISLGITGEIYSNIYNVFRALNISGRTLAPVLLELHMHAIRETHRILRQRRRLDHNPQRSLAQASTAAFLGGEG